MKHLSDSIKVSAVIADKKRMADALNTIGIINDNLGNYANALKSYFRALKVYEEMDELQSKAIALSNIGLVYTNINDYVNALKFYSSANEIAGELNDVESLLVTNINIGLTYRLLKDYANASERLNSALKIAVDKKDKLRESLALLELADVYISTGNKEQAYDNYRRSLEIKYELDDKKGIANILATIGKMQIEDGKLASAKENLKTALHISVELGTKKLTYQVHKLLAEIYEQEGDLRSALNHSKISHAKEIEFFNEESDVRAKNIAIQHEVDEAQKEAEIQRLRNVELAKALGEVRELNEDLQELHEEMNEFMGIAVHDLKNPLQNILSTARVLKRTQQPTTETIDEFTTNIIFQTDRMFNLIKKLLDHNAIEQGNIKVRRTTFSAHTVVESVIESHDENASQKNIKIEFIGPNQEFNVTTDYDILFQILDNLISNAIKFSPKNREITLNLAEETQDIAFIVQDQGPGFTKKDTEKVFMKFARLSAQPTGEEHSTGLGLSIVKKLCELIGADVSLESEEGKGAKFTVRVKKDSLI